MIAADLTPRIGDRLGHGRFELLAKLGEGGMSLVFRARDHVLDREVALKLLLPRYVGRPEREQRLLNEAAYLRRLQGQPRIVEFVDSGTFDELGGWPWLATAVLDGTTLNWLLIDRKLERDAILIITRQIAQCLESCHRCGIVNRDLTPTNVMVVDPATYAIELFDFSHAGSLDAPKVAAGMPGRLTGEFDAPGSFGYMSPEQVLKAPPDPIMDVFGFGALLYEIVTGQTPYAAMGHREAFILAQKLGQLEPLRLHAWAYDVPEALGELVHACTQRSPTQRPTMSEISRRLEQLGAVAIPPVRAVQPSAAARIRARRKLLAASTVTSIAALAWIGVSLALGRDEADDHVDADAQVLAPTAEPSPEPPSHVEPETITSPEPVTSPTDDPPVAPKRPEPRKKPKREPQLADRGTLTTTAACEGVVTAAKTAAGKRDWETALRLASRTECWPSKRDRLRLEVNAYASLGRWADCIRVGSSSNDPEIQARVATCERSR